MEFRQIKGNTWAFYGSEVLPVYLMGNGKCILFDTGFPDEREKLESSLRRENLTPEAIFCSHAHIDHVGSCAYFQKKLGIPLYMSQAEGGILSSVLNMKAYRISVTPQEAKETIGDCVTENVTLLKKDCDCVYVDNFKILVYHTPGHSSEHLCFGTPDGVCYLGDALLSESQLDAKLPYALDIGQSLASMKKILTYPQDVYILAHQGLCEKHFLENLVEQNINMYLRIAQNIRHCAGMGKTIDHLTMDYCGEYKLSTRKPKRIAHYQRNIRFFLEYLEDSGEITMEMSEMGILWKSILEH